MFHTEHTESVYVYLSGLAGRILASGLQGSSTQGWIRAALRGAVIGIACVLDVERLCLD